MSKIRYITDGKSLVGDAMPRLVEQFRKAVIGRKIIDAGYIDYGDDEPWGSSGPTPFLLLDNDTVLTVQGDDEGNGPGVIIASTDRADYMLPETEVKK